MKPYDISPTLRLASSEQCFSLQKFAKSGKDKNSGKLTYTWQAFAWYGTLQQAAEGLARHLIRTSKEPMPQAVADAVHVLKGLCREVEETFTVTL